MSRKESDVSRRDFLKTVGVATTAVSATTVSATQGPAAVGPDAVPITLTINGQRHPLSVEPRV